MPEDPARTVTGTQLSSPAIPNFRDIGGLPTRDGGRVRTGVLYRSSSLAGVADSDVEALAGLGIRTVYDLRMAREHAAAPDRLPPGTRPQHVDILAGWDSGGPGQLFAWLDDPAAARAGLADGRGEALWIDQYQAFVRRPSACEGFGHVFRDLAMGSHRPALVHCATGKDRTPKPDEFALAMAELLAAEGIDAHVLHVPTLKPLDVAASVAAAERTGRVITVEEHTVIGGLGGAIAETLSEHRPTRVDRIGLRDEYVQSGPNEALLDIYGLSAARVSEQVRAIIERR